MKKIIPQKDYILLTEEKEELSKSGIIVPDSADIEQTHPGRVVEVGDKVSLSLRAGDLVLFKRHLFDEIGYNDKKYLFGKEDNILAVLHD